MSANPAWRTVAFILVGLAASLGVATRAVSDRRPPAATQWIVTSEGALHAGQTLGDATVLGVGNNDDRSVRLRIPGCDQPITAVRLSLYGVAVPELADRNYGRADGYEKVDVYDGRVRENFSRLSKLLALVVLKASDAIDGFYVRFYAPRSCAIREDDYVAWASEMLKTPAASPE